MVAPRLEIDLDKIRDNARHLVDWLAPKGISVTGVTKATLGAAGVADAMLRGGVQSLGDARIENLEALRTASIDTQMWLIRSPMLSQTNVVVANADQSVNTEPSVIERLSRAAIAQGKEHAVVLMVELGDLREGVPVHELSDAVRETLRRPNIKLVGLGANLACQSGVSPDQRNMMELSGLVDSVEREFGIVLDVVTGGNSANLDWALSTDDPGRVNNLRLGESILLGCDPLHRRAIPGLHVDAFTFVAEVIEAKVKPSQPWGEIANAAFDGLKPRTGSGNVRQALLAAGHQDVDPDGLVPSTGIRILGGSSDHLVLDTGCSDILVGAELKFGLNYSALVRAMTSPFVQKVYSTVHA